jgi:hypothetical protein
MTVLSIFLKERALLHFKNYENLRLVAWKKIYVVG